MDAEHEKWQWQEWGTAWKEVGLYHITLTVPSREPLLGTLVIPDNDATLARVERTELGEALVNTMFDVQHRHREIQILHFVVMPDHLHTVWYVRRAMPKGIMSVVQGFWIGAKKLGRAYSYTATTSRVNCQEGKGASSFSPTVSREDYKGNTLRIQLGNDAYYALPPIFTEMPFVRSMGQRRQLPATIRYIDMNPQRLATKRLKPDFFRVQHEVELGGRTYDAVGNIAILQAKEYTPVHVRRMMVEAAEHGDDQPLRDYMNGCILKAREGIVPVSPFISPKEKEVLAVLLKEKHHVIYISDNGFGEYYMPTDGLFDAVAEGRMLILSPWRHDPDKRHVTRDECVAMNNMAEELSSIVPN